MLMHDCLHIITLSPFGKPGTWLLAALVMMVNNPTQLFHQKH